MSSRAFAGTDPIIHELIEAFGIKVEGEELIEFTFEARFDECVVMTTTRQNVKIDAMADAIDVVRRYKLVAVEDEEPKDPNQLFIQNFERSEFETYPNVKE